MDGLKIRRIAKSAFQTRSCYGRGVFGSRLLPVMLCPHPPHLSHPLFNLGCSFLFSSLSTCSRRSLRVGFDPITSLTFFRFNRIFVAFQPLVQILTLFRVVTRAFHELFAPRSKSVNFSILQSVARTTVREFESFRCNA